MEIFKIEELSFTYPMQQKKALENISFSINKGDFVCLIGKSGCGKTTLLKLLKPPISPHGNISGKVYFNQKPITELSEREQASKIGFVMQKSENAIVCDKVWHELAFGLENLSIPKDIIRRRVSETATFFGIEKWFHKKTDELSGGQKQILSLACVMVMQPEVIILDEPASQLDPINAVEFLNVLKRINSELGITVIISEHRLENILPVSDNVLVLEDGKILCCDTPQNTGRILKDINSEMFSALPSPMRIYGYMENDNSFPLTVGKGRLWLEEYVKTHGLKQTKTDNKEINVSQKDVICFKDVWFSYEKDSDDILKGMNFSVTQGEIFALLGGNGCGKTTTLSLICNLFKPYRGNILINGQKISKIKDLYTNVLGVVPQDVQTLFVKNTLYEDLEDMLSHTDISLEEQKDKINHVLKICRIEHLKDRHPYDLSGGEQQKAALAKILLLNPQILLLDEPTKGFDAHFKEIFGNILRDLQALGKTIIIVSHDIEFCALYTDRCALIFDGDITSQGPAKEFFTSNTFYTTSVNKMAKNIINTAVTVADLISTLKKES